MMSKYFKGIKLAHTAIIAGVASLLILQLLAFAADKDDAVLVNVDNFARAETAAQFDRMLQLLPGAAINRFVHLRNPVALDSLTRNIC